MLGRLYWIAVATAAAVAAHAGFVLYAPGYWFSHRVSGIAAEAGENNFFILTPAAQAQLFPGLPRSGVTGICVFDVSKGDVVLSADLPDGFWITSIYTDKGEAIYSVNNRQSGSNVFNVSLSRAPGLIETLMQATDKDRPEIDSGWTVMSPEPKGIAAVWYPLIDSAQRTAVAERISRTRCQAAVSPAQ